MKQLVDGGEKKVLNGSEELKTQWRIHYMDWKKSGQSKAEYCRVKGLSKGQFYYWNRWIDKEGEGKAGDNFVPIIGEERALCELMSIEARISKGVSLLFSTTESGLVRIIRELGDAPAIIR